MGYQNGIYKSDNAIYYIKDSRIIMRVMGMLYKTNTNFMQGKYQMDLPLELDVAFNETYSKLDNW